MKAARSLAFAWAVCALAACGDQSQAVDEKAVKLETEDQKTLYAIGVAVASNTLATFKGEFTAEEVRVIKEGFGDGLMEAEPKVDMTLYSEKLNTFLQGRFQNVQARAAVAAEQEKEKGRAYMDKAAGESGAERTQSGLVFQSLALGTGASPSPTDRVKVHYHGTLTDGTVFDSSVDRGEPVTFTLNEVIPGWIEGLQKMKVGGKARLVIPADLAYGDREVGNIPPGSTLVFEVELLGIEKGN